MSRVLFWVSVLALLGVILALIGLAIFVFDEDAATDAMTLIIPLVVTTAVFLAFGLLAARTDIRRNRCSTCGYEFRGLGLLKDPPKRPGA